MQVKSLKKSSQFTVVETAANQMVKHVLGNHKALFCHLHFFFVSISSKNGFSPETTVTGMEVCLLFSPLMFPESGHSLADWDGQ